MQLTSALTGQGYSTSTAVSAYSSLYSMLGRNQINISKFLKLWHTSFKDSKSIVDHHKITELLALG